MVPSEVWRVDRPRSGVAPVCPLLACPTPLCVGFVGSDTPRVLHRPFLVRAAAGLAPLALRAIDRPVLGLSAPHHGPAEGNCAVLPTERDER